MIRWKASQSRLLTFAGVAGVLLAACTGGSEPNEGLGGESDTARVERCSRLVEMPIGKIAYTRYADDGSTAIYLMDPDGSNRTCLVDTVDHDRAAAWSPDGTMLVFQRGADRFDGDLWLVNADGSGLRQLTDDEGGEWTPSWSPDGREIAYGYSETGTDDGPFSIRVMGVDGSGKRTLIQSEGDIEYVGHPVWSPDGTGIALQTDQGGGTQVRWMRPDGSQVTLLADGFGANGPAVWSPDGSRLAFSTERCGGCVFLINADGTGLTRFMSGIYRGGLTWSPDGRSIASAGGTKGPADAYVLNLDGGKPVLIDDTATIAELAWQPV